MHFRTLIISLISLFFVSSVDAQTFIRQYNVPVFEGGTQLKNPWAGGLNSVQISTFDANLDGLEDLFLFDRIGSRISIFIKVSNEPGVIDYRYTMEYDHLFPQNLNNWVLLRDMNCDGKKDICTNTGSSFRIFWNTSSTSLSFSNTSTGAVSATYQYPNSNPIVGAVYSIAADIPAFDDYDGDGDIDIWSWNDESTSMYLYINKAVENGDCSIPDFVCEGRCYGAFGESSESFEIFIGEEFDCDYDVVDPRSADERMHAGGTILTLDLNQDGMKDLVVGDVTETYLIAMEVADNPASVDSVTVLHHDFPSDYASTIPVDLIVFPVGFYEDVNNDGVRDLLVTSNAFSGAEDVSSIWLYINVGSNDLPQFEFVQSDFLQDQMIEVGTNCYPVVFDVDRDGLQDLLVANRFYFSSTSQYTSIIRYYRNTGSATEPSFELADDNWLNVPSLELRAVFPSFGDIDDDGDDDLVLGEQEGRFYLIRNVSSSEGPNVFEASGTFILNDLNDIIDVGQLSTPQIIDLENDGLLDIISGELNGHINYYRNIGTLSQYIFQLAEDSIGDVVASSILGIQGRSVPFFYKNLEGVLELLVGSETGQINHYNDIEDNIFGSFNLLTSTFQNIDEGQRTAVFLRDITGDGLNDMFVGNIGGGLGFYKGSPVSVSEYDVYESQLIAYPNPVNNMLTIEMDRLRQNHNSALAVYDQSGQMIFQTYVTGTTINIDTTTWPSGLYHVSSSDRSAYAHCRVIVVH